MHRRCIEFAWADGSAQRQGWNAVGLGHVNSDRRVTVVSSVANNRYRVQSSDGSSSTLVVRRLIDGSARRKGEGGSVGANAGQNHVRSVQQRMDDHFAARREIEATTVRYGDEASSVYTHVSVFEGRTRSDCWSIS